MIDNLPAHVVEEGKEHPFVLALLRDLKLRRSGSVLEAEGATTEAAVWRHTARSAALRDVIAMIENATGKEDE